jgi:hypothetical protein
VLDRYIDFNISAGEGEIRILKIYHPGKVEVNDEHIPCYKSMAHFKGKKDNLLVQLAHV